MKRVPRKLRRPGETVTPKCKRSNKNEWVDKRNTLRNVRLITKLYIIKGLMTEFLTRYNIFI